MPDTVFQTTIDSSAGLQQFASQLNEELERCRRYGHNLSIAVVYIDALPQLKEKFGQLTANTVANIISEVVKSSLREEDVCVGLSDHSFIIILSGLSSAQAACTAQNIKDKIDAHIITYNWQNIKVSVSIGLATYPTHGNETDKLVAGATAAAQFALGAGGDRIVIA
jgi:diguanylate cyclase (GGDEF)-like protein